MADDGNIKDASENKNPLYALSQTQDEDIVTLDQSPGANRRFRPVESHNDGKGNEATVVKGPVLYKPDQSEMKQQSTSGSSSGSLSPVSTMQSKAMRARLDNGRGENASDERKPEIKCPRVNCKEKIIICLDLSKEMDSLNFKSRSGDKFPSLKLIKRALGIYLQSKQRINKNHEYALVFLRQNAYWVCDFTNDPYKIMTIMEDLDTHPTESFDLTNLFEELRQHIQLPKIDNPKVVPPPYIVRTIFIYGRSHCVPVLKSKEAMEFLNSSPYFFFDAFYIHEQPSDENKCELIFEQLCELDRNGFSYVFEVARNPTKLYDYMAQLLPHPLQRPSQNDSHYSLATTEHNTECRTINTAVPITAAQ